MDECMKSLCVDMMLHGRLEMKTEISQIIMHMIYDLQKSNSSPCELVSKRLLLRAIYEKISEMDHRKSGKLDNRHEYDDDDTE